MDYTSLSQTLAESFKALADEVQTLIDRKTILEHKLRFAHEQYQSLADKYAPAVPEIAETLAQLQLPPDVRSSELADSGFVPLPQRGQSATGGRSQHQLALFIREGRKAAQQLAILAETSKDSRSSKETLSPVTDTMTSISNTLERDFTVEGKRGSLCCPFSGEPSKRCLESQNGQSDDVEDPTPHHSSDPICAAMYEDMPSTRRRPSVNSSAAAKCPIRFLDQHSPEEIARYVETHKHEIPRSHEVCVRRYQRNEEQIRKLDAKYGNLVSMIKDLSHLHQPMLQGSVGPEHQQGDELDTASNERVENWAQQVSSGGAEGEDEPDHADLDVAIEDEPDEDRQSHFDRPLKEVRVGESPSRPWGISVPVPAFDRSVDDERQDRPISPPPAPVQIPTTNGAAYLAPPGGGVSKCPFGHSKLLPVDETRPSGKGVKEEPSPSSARVPPPHPGDFSTDRHRPGGPHRPPQATFIHQPASGKPGDAPQMIFTGPVFIGYPMEQAIQFMQQLQGDR